MGEARIRVSFEFLRSVLHLPDATQIHDVEGRSSAGDIEMTVSHPDIPDRSPVGTGRAWPPFARPQFKKQPEVVFLGWNVEDETQP